jgi:hypothetical protein
MRVKEGAASTVMLSATVQGELRPSVIITVRCESSNVSLLHVGCPDEPLLGSPAVCEVPMMLPTGNISVSPIAVDDYDNSGHPATKTASLLCSSSAANVDVRGAAVNYSITNVVRPVFGEASLADVAYSIDAHTSGQALGSSVVSSPDLGGDTRTEVLFGAPGAGELGAAYLFFGGQP